MADISQFLNLGLIDLGGGDLNSALEAKVVPAVNFIVAFSALIAIILIIVSGYTLITSAGDPEKIQKGQQGLTAAIVGMVIVFLARIIVIFVIGLVAGVN